ncbi:YkgJ family cysteine cluster protein [Pseudoalteromonas sp. 120-MNA-CIBAN-0494]|uniref:YkgJ family cysteine cluster protein n=1 Tax=unclassified Pseudoalteromonas TaxID=194690 RepID=UPI0033283425
MEFPCTKCGKCCSNVNLSPITSYLDRGDGTCEHFDDNTKHCKIYDNRPEICRIELQFNKYYKERFSWNEFIAINLDVCEKLPEK